MDYDFLPPPAYSEQGSKVTGPSAVHPAMNVTQPHAPTEEDEEAWEEDYDKSAREITDDSEIQNALPYRSATSDSSGSSSRRRPLPRRPSVSADGNGRAAVPPLRIHKKSQSAPVGSSNSSKSQSNWYMDSETGIHDSFAGRNVNWTTVPSSSHSHPTRPDDSPPPPFSALSRVYPGSSPPSPLSSPTTSHASLPSVRSSSQEQSQLQNQLQPIHTRPMQPRNSLPSPSQAYQTPPRPVTSYSPSSQYSSHPSAISHVEYNHSNAYSKRQARAERPLTESSSPVEPVDVNALYNSAVSGYLPRTSHFTPLNRAPYSVNYNQSFENAQHAPRQAVNRAGGVYHNTTPNSSIPRNATTVMLPTSTSSTYEPSSNPQFPLYPGPPPGPNPNVGLDRWATSEQQFTQNFQ